MGLGFAHGLAESLAQAAGLLFHFVEALEHKSAKKGPPIDR